jgi:hypothetical protein
MAFSQYVTRSGARMLVKRAAKEGRVVVSYLPRNLIAAEGPELIATESTVTVARHLVDEIFKRLQRGNAVISTYEASLVEELAGARHWRIS